MSDCDKAWFIGFILYMFLGLITVFVLEIIRIITKLGNKDGDLMAGAGISLLWPVVAFFLLTYLIVKWIREGISTLKEKYS